MDVYFCFRPTKRRGTVYPLEFVRNKEVPGRLLQTRIRTKTSRTLYLHSGNEEEEKYPWADESGYLMVWVRWAGALPPKPGVIPDERWYLTDRGAVVRDPWDLPDEAVTGSDVDVVRTSLETDRSATCEFCGRSGR